MREKNRMSAREFREQAAWSDVSWQEWERKFDGLLREYRWHWWRDRVIPAGPIRRLLYAHRVPKPVVEKIISLVQSIGRKEGLPDRIIAKDFGYWEAVPLELRKLLGKGPLRWAEPPFTIIGFVELKTGKATTTDAQDEWLKIASLCPGAFQLVSYPEQTPYIRQVLGGKAA